MMIDIVSAMSKEEVFRLCEHSFPGLKWHMGESDMGGGYVTGIQPGVRLQCWTGENPMSLSLSFMKEVAEEDREHWVAAARDVLALQIGAIAKISSR